MVSALEAATLCPECGVSFSHSSYLKTHIKIVHEKVRGHSCRYCDKRFSVKFSLERHVRQVHTKIQPYQCNYCPLKFADSTTKSKHEVKHTKVKTFRCNVCNKTFGYSNVLKAHMKTHDNERQFICSICQKDFALKYNLEVHLKGHMRRQYGFKGLQNILESLQDRNGSKEKQFEPLFVETDVPQILPCALLPPVTSTQGNVQIQIFNLPKFSLNNPNQPLKVYVANI